MGGPYRGGVTKEEGGGVNRSTWQLKTGWDPDPRPSTRSPRHEHRRGVEGGSSPLGINRGTRRKAEEEGRGVDPLNVASRERPDSVPPARTANRPTPAPAGGQGGRPPWASPVGGRRGSSPEPFTVDRSPSNVASADASTSTPPAKHDSPGTTTGGGSKGGRPRNCSQLTVHRRTWQVPTPAPPHPRPSTTHPEPLPAGGRRGVVPGTVHS